MSTIKRRNDSTAPRTTLPTCSTPVAGGPVDPPGHRGERVSGSRQILDHAVVQVRRDLAALPFRCRQRPLQQGGALRLVPGDPAGRGTP